MHYTKSVRLLRNRGNFNFRFFGLMALPFLATDALAGRPIVLSDSQMEEVTCGETGGELHIFSQAQGNLMTTASTRTAAIADSVNLVAAAQGSGVATAASVISLASAVVSGQASAFIVPYY
jgi:hypothetical protein